MYMESSGIGHHSDVDRFVDVVIIVCYVLLSLGVLEYFLVYGGLAAIHAVKFCESFVYRRVLFVILVLCLLIVHPALVEPFTGKVVGISDGDTLSVLREGKAVKVRLYGIDAPEKAQAFGTKAQQFTSELAFQREVTVVVHTTDRYGRLVGEVLLPDGRSLTRELVRAGLAWWYRQYAPKETALAQLETEARAAKRGLWAEAQPVPPWEWRKPHRALTRGEAPGVSTAPSTETSIVGNRRSKVYH